MSDLYVEITDRNYNDGKPFVPIIEMANMCSKADDWRMCNTGHGDYVYSRRNNLYFAWDECEAEQCFSLWTNYVGFAEEQLITRHYKLFDLLNLLKFDYLDLIPAGLAISVHDLSQNPYETANN